MLLLLSFFNLLCFNSRLVLARDNCHSLYSLSQEAHDIVVVKITKVSGPAYGKKARAEVLERLKSKVKTRTITLPFSYQTWQVGSREIRSKRSFKSVHFKPGYQYVALIQKTKPGKGFFSNLNKAKTTYEVVPCENPSWFDMSENGARKLWLLRQYINVHTLKKPDEKLRVLEKCAIHSAPDNRSDVLKALTLFKEPKAEDMLIGALKQDKSDLVRATAARSLRKKRSDKAKRALIFAVRFDPAENVKISAANSLSDHNNLAQYPKLKDGYKTASFQLRKALIGAYQSSTSADALAVLEGFYLQTSSPVLQQNIIDLAGNFKLYEASAFCFKVFKDSGHQEVKQAALKSLSKIGNAEFFHKLLPYFNEPCKAGSENLQITMLQTLSGLGNPTNMLPIFNEVLNCRQKSLRKEAIIQLNRSPQKESRFMLKSALKRETDAELRRLISEGLKSKAG
jgi:HEAT repeat protein